MIIDNSIVSFGYNLDNGIPICSWFDNWKDQEVRPLLCFVISSCIALLASCTPCKRSKTFVLILPICLDCVKRLSALNVNEPRFDLFVPTNNSLVVHKETIYRRPPDPAMGATVSSTFTPCSSSFLTTSACCSISFTVSILGDLIIFTLRIRVFSRG